MAHSWDREDTYAFWYAHGARLALWITPLHAFLHASLYASYVPRQSNACVSTWFPPGCGPIFFEFFSWLMWIYAGYICFCTLMLFFLLCQNSLWCLDTSCKVCTFNRYSYLHFPHTKPGDELSSCSRFFSGQRPPMLMPSEPSSNFLKPLALKKGMLYRCCFFWVYDAFFSNTVELV